MNKSALSLEQHAKKLRDAGKGYEAAQAYADAKQAYLAVGDTAHAAGCQHMIGVSFKIENDITKALPAYTQAIADYQNAGDVLGAGRVARDIGVMYEYHDRFAEAETYLLQSKKELASLPSDTKHHQHVHEATTRDAELGITLAKIGLLYTRQQKFTQAENALFEGLQLIRQAGHPFYEATALMHLGALYFGTKHYSRMLANVQAALGLLYEHKLEADQPRRKIQIWGLMAHGYLHHGNRAMAAHFAKKSLVALGELSHTAQEPLKKDIQADELQKLTP